MQFPHLDARLVEVLDSLYPDRCPDPNDSDREIWMKTGERRIVAFLKTRLAQQDDDPTGPQHSVFPRE